MRQQSNLSKTDRVIRLILGGAALGFGAAFGPIGWIAGGIAAALLWLSAWTGFCHVYKVLGIDTYGRTKPQG